MKTFIKNRKGQKIAVLVEENSEAKGLAFVMHGLSGYKEQPQIEMFAAVFQENEYTTVCFDTTYTVGESDVELEDVTFTNTYHDLEDVINWASTQDWYQEPFCLIGHSLGGLSGLLYTEKHPEKIKAIAPISSVIGGKLKLSSPYYKRIVPQWKADGFREWESLSRPGEKSRVKWSYVEDLMQYDSLAQADKIIMPVFIAYGENDDGMPPEHRKMLVDAIAGPVEYHEIKDVTHTFRKPEKLKELRTLLNQWIKTL